MATPCYELLDGSLRAFPISEANYENDHRGHFEQEAARSEDMLTEENALILGDDLYRGMFEQIEPSIWIRQACEWTVTQYTT